MGSFHSVYFVMRINLHIVGQARWSSARLRHDRLAKIADSSLESWLTVVRRQRSARETRVLRLLVIADSDLFSHDGEHLSLPAEQRQAGIRSF